MNTMYGRLGLTLSLGLALGACSGSERPAPKPSDGSAAQSPPGDGAALPARNSGGPRRVLLVIADDLGVDAIAAYADINGVDSGERPYPATPTIDSICKGVRFTRAWATPTCTPTRGSIITGQYGFRTGLDGVGRGKEIRAGQMTLPKLVGNLANTANIGKWHLGHDDSIGGLRTPNEMGWDHYAGAIDNLDGYFEYTKVVDGKEVAVDNYATTETVDDALRFIGTQGAEDSWLVWLAFNAPHGPFHLPPESLHAHAGATDPAEHYDAMVEALDTELGRLLAALPDGVDVVFLGDNGSPARTIRRPLDKKHSKGTLYEGGLHVPLCVSGPTVKGSRSEDALVSSVDLYATVAELLGADPLPASTAGDSSSLVPYLRGESQAGHAVIFSQQNRSHERKAKAKNVGGKAIRDERYKLIVFEDGNHALFDLERDPGETRNLYDDASGKAARAKLEAALAEL
ncbi:MAG: sulfatase-like hydrolase/transferase [Myxococcota bacterium]